MLKTIKSFLNDERSETSREYAIVFGIVSVALISTSLALKDELGHVISIAASKFNT